MSNPTIYDVAKAAGVGIGTVSRVLNNSTQVSPDTQEKVQKAIRELGFRRSKVARQLSRGIQRHNVGAIMPLSHIPRLRVATRTRPLDDCNDLTRLYSVSEQSGLMSFVTIVEHASRRIADRH